MTDNTELFDSHGRVIRALVSNTAKDGSGTYYFPLLDSDAHLQVDALSAVLAAGTSRIGTVQPDMNEVRVSKAIDASIGAYAAGDVVNDDDCSTTATSWQLTGAASAVGGYGRIWNVKLINETENQAVSYRILFFNDTPTGELTDNSANTNPVKADRSKYLGEIQLPSSIARGATVATYTQASPSTVGDLPLDYKCAAGSTTLYFVLVTDTAYTQTATDDIEIIFEIEHC